MRMGPKGRYRPFGRRNRSRQARGRKPPFWSMPPNTGGFDGQNARFSGHNGQVTAKRPLWTKRKIPEPLQIQGFRDFFGGAADGSRTRTPIRTQAPQACQSTNSSTAAKRGFFKPLDYYTVLNRICQRGFLCFTPVLRILRTSAGRRWPPAPYRAPHRAGGCSSPGWSRSKPPSGRWGAAWPPG